MTSYNEYLNRLDESSACYELDVSAKRLTSFKTGGSVDVCVYPSSADELIFVITLAEEMGIRSTVLGRGTNTLFSDCGYKGVLILTEKMNECRIIPSCDGAVMICDCGVPLTYASALAAKHGLTGLEFAYGIPGSCGGAVFMNAGAYGGEISDLVIETVCYDTRTKKVITLAAHEHQFDYRKSVFSTSNSELIILKTTLKLKNGDSEEINSLMNANKEARIQKQPLDMPNAGSVFKRYPGYFIGKIIDDMGLKGYSVGDAQVSTKHAGFIINKGNASTDDIKSLIGYIKERIINEYGFEPECEIRFIEE